MHTPSSPQPGDEGCGDVPGKVLNELKIIVVLVATTHGGTQAVRYIIFTNHVHTSSVAIQLGKRLKRH